MKCPYLRKKTDVKSCSGPCAVNALQRGKSTVSYLIKSCERLTKSTVKPPSLSSICYGHLKRLDFLCGSHYRHYLASPELMFCSFLLCMFDKCGMDVVCVTFPSSSAARLHVVSLSSSLWLNYTSLSTFSLSDYSLRCPVYNVCFGTMNSVTGLSYLTEKRGDSLRGLLLLHLESETDMRSTRGKTIVGKRRCTLKKTEVKPQIKCYLRFRIIS